MKRSTQLSRLYLRFYPSGKSSREILRRQFLSYILHMHVWRADDSRSYQIQLSARN